MFVEVIPFQAFLMKPSGVGVGIGPVWLRMVRPPEIVIAIVDARFNLSVGTGSEVQFSRKAAAVTGIGKQPGKQKFILRDLLAILTALRRPGIAAGEKAGATGRTDRDLAIGTSKGDTVGTELIQVRRVNPTVAKRADGIESLLIGTEPENVGAIDVGHVGRIKDAFS